MKLEKKDFVDFYLNIFKKLIGKNGTIICPSFSYSWGQDKKKKIFDINNTQGKTGVFSEYLRQQRGSKRTLDPMFSFISIGKKSLILQKPVMTLLEKIQFLRRCTRKIQNLFPLV